MDNKLIILMILILFGILIAIMQAQGLIDITTIFNRIVKQEKPEQVPYIEFIQPPAHGYHPVYYDGEDYYTYVIFRTKKYFEYTPSIVTSFPLKGNPILLAKYKDEEGNYVYELLVKSSKIKSIAESISIGQYLITFYPQIEDVSDKWGIEILSPEDGSKFNINEVSQITVYILNKYNKFVYTGGQILINGVPVTILSMSVLTAQGETPLQQGVEIDSGDVIKVVIDISDQTPGNKVLTAEITTQNHGTLSDNVQIVFEGKFKGNNNIQITDILVDGASAQLNNGVYEIQLDTASEIELVATYKGDSMTSTNVKTTAYSTPVDIGIYRLKHIRTGNMLKLLDPFKQVDLEADPLKLLDNDELYVKLSKTDLEKIADGQVHTLYLRVYNSENGEWIEDSVQVRIEKANLQITLTKPQDDETINVGALNYGLYDVKWENIGERAIIVSDIIVKFEDVNNPDNIYIIQPATPVNGNVVDINTEDVFYINLIKAGIPTGDYRVTLLVFDQYQATPIEAPEHPVVHILVPDQRIALVSPQPYATVDTEKEQYINTVIKNIGTDTIQINPQDGITFYWIPLDSEGDPDYANAYVIPSSLVKNYDDIIATYSTFEPGQQFTATIPVPSPDQLSQPVNNFMLAVEVTKTDNYKLSDSVQPIIIYKQCPWGFIIYSVTDDADGGDPLVEPDLWKKEVGIYKEIILKNIGSYPIQFSANDIAVIIEDEQGNTITLPIDNKGSLSPTSGTNYWYPGKTIKLITSTLGIPPETYTLKVSMKNYLYCADHPVKEATRNHLTIEAPPSTCSPFLTILSPTDNTYVDLSQLDEEVGRAGIFRIKVNLDTVALSQSTGETEFTLERISVILKDANGNVVYLFTPRTEILNYDDIVSKVYTVDDNTIELVVDAGGLVHYNLIGKPLTLEVSTYIPSVNCYDFDSKDNIYFIYPDERIFEAVLTKYTIPATSLDIQQITYENGEIISPSSLLIDLETTMPTMKVWAINDAGDYDNDEVVSTMPVIITKVNSPRFYDPDNRITYYAKYCDGTSRNEGILWAKLYEISWCIDFSTVPPTEYEMYDESTGNYIDDYIVVPSGYTLKIPVEIKDETTGKVQTIYLNFPGIHIKDEAFVPGDKPVPPVIGFTPKVVQPTKDNNNDQFPEYSLWDTITIVVKRPSNEENEADVDLTTLNIVLIDAYTGAEYRFDTNDISILTKDDETGGRTVWVLTDSDLSSIDTDGKNGVTVSEWENWADANSGGFMTVSNYITTYGQYVTLPASQNSYLVLRIDTTKYKGSILPSYYEVRLDVTAEYYDSGTGQTLEFSRQAKTDVKLINDDGTGNPVVWFEYPMNGQEITLNLESMFLAGALKAGGILDYLPALKDTVARYGLNYNSNSVEVVNKYFRDYWARENYRIAVEVSYNKIQSGEVPQEIANIWYWLLTAKEIDTTTFSKYKVNVKLTDIDTMSASSGEKNLLRVAFHDPVAGDYFQIFQSVMMALETGATENPAPLSMKGVIRTIIGDMSPSKQLTVKLVAKPEGYDEAPDDPELFPVVTFKVDVITETRPYIEYPNGNTIKVGIQDFERVYSWNELTQIIGQPQGDLAGDVNFLSQLQDYIYFYSYGQDSYDHQTYVKIFNPSGVNTKLVVTPIGTIVDPMYTNAFQDVADNKFSIAPGVIMRQEYTEWEPAETHRYKLPLEIYYFSIPNTVFYRIDLVDAVSGEVYDSKTIAIIPYNTGTAVNPFTYIQPQENDNVDVWELSDQAYLEGDSQQTGSKLYAGATVQEQKPVYFWSYLKSRIYFYVKDIKVYVDGNEVEIEGVRIIDASGKEIKYTPGMKITPGMSIGVKFKVATATLTIETNANGGRRIIDKSFTYAFSLGKHKLKVVMTTTDEKQLVKEVSFNLYNSKGKQYIGKIVYPRMFSQISTSEYYNNQLVVKIENQGEAFTYSSIDVKVNDIPITPSDVKLIHYDSQTTLPAEPVTLTQGTIVSPGDIVLIYIPADTLFENEDNRIDATIHTSDGSVLETKTVFLTSGSFNIPYIDITVLNMEDNGYYNTYYTDKIVVLYQGYNIVLEKAGIKIDDTPIQDLEPVSLIRGSITQELTEGTVIQSGDVLVFKIKDVNTLPSGFHIITVVLKPTEGELASDTIRTNIVKTDWGSLKSIKITSPDKLDYLLNNKPIIITTVNEKAPFTIQSYTITIDGQAVTPQKALKLGLTVEQLASGVQVGHAETLYFEIDPTSINLETGVHTIEVTITTDTSETLTDTKVVFLYDPLMPTNVILLNPTGDIPNLVTSLLALGGYITPSADGQYIDLDINWYPVSFTWDKGKSPMTSIEITIDGVTFTLGDGIDQIIVKKRDGGIVNWDNSLEIQSGDVVTAYVNFEYAKTNKGFEFHLFKYNPDTGMYSISVPHYIEVKVNGITVNGKFDPDTGTVVTGISEELHYKTIERIVYLPIGNIRYETVDVKFTLAIETWKYYTPIYYQVVEEEGKIGDCYKWWDEYKRMTESQYTGALVTTENDEKVTTLVNTIKEECCADVEWINKDIKEREDKLELCGCDSPVYAQEHPDVCKANEGWVLTCEEEYSMLCAIKDGGKTWEDFGIYDPAQIALKTLIACICEAMMSAFGKGCDACEDSLELRPDCTWPVIPDCDDCIPHIPDGGGSGTGTSSTSGKSVCVGTFVTEIKRITKAITMLQSTGDKLPAGATQVYYVNGRAVQLVNMDVTTEDGAHIVGTGVLIDGFNPYIAYTISVDDINPSDEKEVVEYTKTVTIPIPSDWNLVDPKTRDPVSITSQVFVNSYFVKGECNFGCEYNKEVLEYFIKLLIPELQYSDVMFTEEELMPYLDLIFKYKYINGELNLLHVLPLIEYPTEEAPIWIYEEDIYSDGLIIPVQVTVYSGDQGTRVTDIKLYYDDEKMENPVPQDKYLTLVIKKTDTGIQVIPYSEWDGVLDAVTQFYIIFIPDSIEVGEHNIGVEFVTDSWDNVGMVRRFSIKPAINWELLLTSVPDVVYKEFGTTIPVYIKNKGLDFKYKGVEVFIDGNPVTVTEVKKLSTDTETLVTLNPDDIVKNKEMIMFPLDISGLTEGEHTLDILVNTGFVKLSLSHTFKVENEMKFFKITVTQPTADNPLIYNDERIAEIYVKNEGDPITFGGVSALLGSMSFDILSVEKVTDTGLVSVNSGDLINSQEVLKLKVKLPDRFSQTIPLMKVLVTVGIVNQDTNEVLSDTTETMIGHEDILSGYSITIQSPTSETTLSKDIFTAVKVYIRNDRQPITIENVEDVKIKVDGALVTPNWIKVVRTDGTVATLTTPVTLYTGDVLVAEISISSLADGTHTVSAEIKGKGVENDIVEVSDTSMFTVTSTPKNYAIRISYPGWGSSAILTGDSSSGLPVYVTVTGEAMKTTSIVVNINGEEYVPTNVKVGKTSDYIDFTPGVQANHFDVIMFTIPQSKLLSNNLNKLYVTMQTDDGVIVRDGVSFTVTVPSLKDYITIVMPQNGQEYVRVPFKTKSVSYYNSEVKVGEEVSVFKRAQNRFLYGVKDANTLINSYNELIGLINKYPVGGYDNPTVRQMVSTNSDYVRPFIQMVEWTADIQELYDSLVPGATISGYKNILQFYVDASKFIFTDYDPNIVMRFKVVDANVEKLGEIARIYWRGKDGVIHSTRLIMYKGLVIPEEITLFDFIMTESIGRRSKVTVPVFYGFDYSGDDKVFTIQVEVIDKSIDSVLDSKTFKLRVVGKKFKDPVGFRLVYPMSLYNDYYKTAYTPLSQWVSTDLPVYIEWFDYLYKFDPRTDNWFMGFNWVDEQGTGYILGVGKDDTGFYYRYNEQIVYVDASDIEEYISNIPQEGLMYNLVTKKPDSALIWFPSLDKFKTTLGWTETELEAFKKKFVEESYTVDGKTGTNFVFIVYTATKVSDDTIADYRFADKSHIIWGYNEIQLELEPIIKDVDNDQIPDYLITLSTLQEAMTSPVWQNTEYYQEAYNNCGSSTCILNGLKMGRLAHKQVGFTLRNKGSLLFNINDIRKDLKFNLESTYSSHTNMPISVLNAPSTLTPRSSAEIWVVMDEVEAGDYTMTATLQTTGTREDWLTQFQEVTGIDLDIGTTKTETVDVAIDIKDCGTTPSLCIYYNRMIELIKPANAEEIYLEEYHNRFPFNFKLYLDDEYLLKKFIISVMKESEDSVFYLRYFDPQSGVIETEELIQQGLGNPTFNMEVTMNPEDRNDWQYITKIISSTGEVTEQLHQKEDATIYITNELSTQPVVTDMDTVYGELGLTEYPEENIGLNIVSIEVVLEDPDTGETITLKDANADVLIGRRVQPRDGILEIESPTADAVDTEVPLQVVSTCVQALQLKMLAESDLQIYSKTNSDFIKQTLEGTCDIPYTEDYTEKKIMYIDPLPVGEFKVMMKVYDPTCNCVYEIPPEAWEHLRPPVDSGITSGTTSGELGSSGEATGGRVLPASGTDALALQTVVKKVTVEPFNLKEYTILNAGGYAWKLDETTVKIGYGDVGGTIYLDNALDKYLQGRAVWKRASWYIMLIKNPDGTGTIKIKYSGSVYKINIDNMAGFLGMDNSGIIPIQGYLTVHMPSIDQIIDKAKIVYGEGSSTYENIEYALEHIKTILTTIDEHKLAMFTYTGTPQGEDYNEYAVTLVRPDKFIRIINIADGESPVNLNGYTLPVSIVNYGTSPITLSSAHLELYDYGDYATTPYIVETEEDVAGVIMNPQDTIITINFNLKNFLLKTASQGQIKKLVLVVEDTDGDAIKFPVYDITIQFTDYAFSLIYPDSNIVDALYTSSGEWHIPIKLKVIYEYVDEETGETVTPPIIVDKIEVTWADKTVTKQYSTQFQYGDVITFWVNLRDLGGIEDILSGFYMTISYTYEVVTREGTTTPGTQEPTTLTLTVYPSTGLETGQVEESYIFSDLIFQGTEVTLTNTLHKPIIKPVNGGTTEFQLQDYYAEYTVLQDGTTPLMNIKYYKDHVEWTNYISGQTYQHTLTYKSSIPEIDNLQPGEYITYPVYGLNNLQTESKVEYNNLINELLQVASQIASGTATVQFKFTYTYTTIYNGETLTITHQTPEKQIILKEYDPIVSFPTSNSLLYIPNSVNQVSIIIYNIGKNDMTIDLSNLQVTFGNIVTPVVYVKDSQGNTYTTGTVTLTGIGGTNPYIIIRVQTSYEDESSNTVEVKDGLYNININFNTPETGAFTLRVTNIQVKKVDEVNMFEPEWDTVNSAYTLQYGSNYITLPLTYPPEYYGTFGDIVWKDLSTGTPYFKLLLYRIEPASYDTPQYAGKDKVYSEDDGTLTGVFIDSLNNDNEVITQGETLGAMIPKSQTISVEGASVTYSEFFKGINRVNLIYTNPDSDFNSLIVLNRYFIWDGSIPLWLDFKFNGWYFEDFNWRIPVEVDPTTQIDSAMVGYVIKITLDVSNNQELKESLETLVDTDGDGVADTPAWQTKQVGVRVTYYDPAFEDINNDGNPESAEAEVPFYIDYYDGTITTLYIKVPIIKPEDVGQRILNIYYYGAPYIESS